MDHLLAATDLSPASASAVVRGDALARATGGRLHVIAVVDPPGDADAVAQTGALLDRLLGDLGVDADAEVRVGRTFAAIIEAAHTVDADLVVVGAHGRHASSPRGLGTTADRVVRKSDRPVLVVRADPASPTYRRVLVGTDLSEGAAEAFRFARSALPEATVSVALVRTVPGEHLLAFRGVTDDQLDALRHTVTDEGDVALGEWLAAHGLDADERVTTPGDPATELVALAGRGRHDLLVVGAHGSHGAHDLLLGSTSQRVLRDAATDVLVVRAGSSVRPELDPGRR